MRLKVLSIKTIIVLKVKKAHGFTPSLEDTFLKKPQEKCQIYPHPSLLRVNQSLKQKFIYRMLLIFWDTRLLLRTLYKMICMFYFLWLNVGQNQSFDLLYQTSHFVITLTQLLHFVIISIAFCKKVPKQTKFEAVATVLYQKQILVLCSC